MMQTHKNVKIAPVFYLSVWNNSIFLRFLLIGGLNTSFSYLVYAGGLFIGLDYKIANLGAVILGILFSFKMQGTLVFNNVKWRLFFRYVLFWMLLYRLNILCISTIMQFGFNAYQAGALALLPITLLSFLIQKIFIFKPVSKKFNV